MLKTFWTNWHDRQLPDGTVIWTSPSGQTFQTTAGGFEVIRELADAFSATAQLGWVPRDEQVIEYVELLCGIARPKHRYGSRVATSTMVGLAGSGKDAPRASSCGTTSATVTACGVRLVHFARHTGHLRLLPIVVDRWLDQRRWHRQRWLRPECVENFALRFHSRSLRSILTKREMASR